MKRHLLMLIFLLLISGELYAQKLEGQTIKLHAITSMQEYFAETSCFDSKIMIKFKFKDSISLTKLRADSTYSITSKSLRNIKDLDFKNDTVINLLKKLDAAMKANTVYIIDSIKIDYNQYPEYEKLLATILNSTQTELENKENNKNRYVLDGTRMNFEFFKNDAINFNAYAHSPSKLSHPLLYEYVNSTMNIYREVKKNNFPTKKQTGGY